MSYADHYDPQDGIAIVGMAGRFPGADSVDALWQVLLEGRETISRFEPDELEPAHGEDMDARGDPGYVRARGVLEGIDRFDDAFFGFSPAEAALLDPQQRLFLQAAWEALEHAGHDPRRVGGPVGVYAGGTANSYYLNNLQSRRDLTDRLGLLTTQMGNQGHYIATRVAYKLDLKGPALNIHTACSTSMVAVCTAVQALQSFQCDMALAGGVSVTVPQKRGYLHQEGSILSPDGHCRPFDADAAGTVFGNGLGVVVLRRLQDALADGDTVYAVIKGAALNNDGHGKLSFTAPSVDGQAEVIAMAQALAGIDPATIAYVEAHGTGTELGDPIEVAALTQAFRAGGATAPGTCAIGSLKSNIGHLDAAAGVAGLIKAALALHHKTLPATLHFRAPNPKLNLQDTPFVVQDRRAAWPEGPTPRRAGVSSFGVGGTNAHVVLEEAPAPAVVPVTTPQAELLVLSARDEAALARATTRLAEHLEQRVDTRASLADAAFTLQSGRQRFAYRRAVVAADGPSAAQQLQRALQDDAHIPPAPDDAAVAFVFPGQGAQQVGMGRGLYMREPVFRREIDEGAAVLQPVLGRDLREILYPASDRLHDAQRELGQTAITQPALFLVEYAMARLWMSWGIQPQALIGHSVGEYVAACLAGTFDRDDALRLVAQRARLMQSLPAGSMLAVRASMDQLPQPLDPRLSVAAVNGPQAIVLSGETDAIHDLVRSLEGAGLPHRTLATSHAFHSAMLEPILEAFETLVAAMPRQRPQQAWISSLTGQPITAEEALSARYWVQQMRQPVQFGTGIRTLIDRGLLLLEVGPGAALCQLARQQGRPAASVQAVPSLPQVDADGARDRECLLQALGQLWTRGAEPAWPALHDAPRRRIPLPGYAFDLQRRWVDPADHNPSATAMTSMGTAGPPTATGLEPRGTGDVPASQDAAPVPMSAVPGQPEAAAAADPHPDAVPTPEPISSSPMTRDRASVLQQRLQTLFAELAGLDAAGVDPRAGFLELGLDSLLLTQASQSLGRSFGHKVPMRVLLEECPTIETLARYLDERLPAEAVPIPPPAPAVAQPPAPPAVMTAVPHEAATPHQTSRAAQRSDANLLPAPAATTGPAVSGPWAELLAQQVALMSRQLDMLQALGATVAVPPASPAPVLPTAAPPVAGPAALALPVDVATARGHEDDRQVSTQKPPAPSDAVTAFGPYRPPVRQAAAGITPEQTAQLRRFVERYNARTAGSKRMTEQHRAHLADPRSVSGFRLAWKELVYPLVSVRSAGSQLWDVDGNAYVDITNGFGMILFGHNPDFIRQAIEDQLRTGYEIGPQTPLAGEVADIVCRMVGMERAAFCGSGSEAVTAAIRVARTVTGRDTVVMFNGAYHGIFDEVLARPGRAVAGQVPRGMPIAPGIPAAMTSNLVVLEYGSEEALQTLRELGTTVAAVLVEPVQSRRPDLQPREFLNALREITRAHDSALVFDEVVTGFRVHPGGAQAVFDVRADIATFGKVVGGGLPIGIVAGSARFLDALDGGAWRYGDDSVPEAGVTFFAGTFVRHPLALAAARAVLQRLEADGPELQRSLNLRTSAFVARLRDLAAACGAPLSITHFASWFCFQFAADQPLSSLFFAAMRLHGVHVWEGRPCFLTLAHSDQDLDRVAQAFQDALHEMQRAGFLAGQPPAVDGPPVPGARRGRDPEGREAWFVADPQRPGKYLQVQTSVNPHG